MTLLSYITSSKIAAPGKVAILLVIGIVIAFLLMRRRKQAILAIFSIIAALLVAEGALRIFSPKIFRYSPHPYLIYYGTPNYVSSDGKNIHNSMGFRGPEIITPKPQNVYRIALIGGSSAYEEYVRDWRHDFARQIEAELKKNLPEKNIEVINAAMSGYSSWEDLVNVAFRVTNLAPDMLFIYEGGNDVHARFVPAEKYRSDNTGWRSVWKDTACTSLLCLRLVQLLTGLEPVDYYRNEQPFAGSMERLEQNPPIYFERNIRSIIAIAKEHNIAPVFITWAYSNQFGDYAATPWYERGFKEHNEIIKELGLSHSVPVIDLASQMPMDKKYWVDGRHNNESGVELKAKIVSEFLVGQHLIQ